MSFDPTPEFKAAFNMVMSHYGCSVEEARYEKQRIMKSVVAYYWAERCYLEIAREINEGLL